MRLRHVVILASVGLLSFLGVMRAQKPFKDYPAIEYNDFPLPSDWEQKTEWTRARLRYPDIVGFPNARYRDGRQFPGYWTMDYPRSDRHLLAGVRRLTRIDTRSVEQVVDLDGTDEIYNWPVAYAVEVGHWKLPADQAGQLRQYLLRGGFLMVDDFHGSNARDHNEGINEWQNFVDGMSLVFPGRQIQEIPDNDPIFHTLYDLQARFQVPGAQYYETGLIYEKGPTGKPPHWRCIRDDQGRI